MAEKRLIDANASNVEDISCYYGSQCYIEDVQAWLDEQPTVDAVEVVRGRWVHCNGKSNLWYCSVCGEKILYNPTRRTYNIEKRPVYEVNKYCRCCGAKMVGEEKQ